MLKLKDGYDFACPECREDFWVKPSLSLHDGQPGFVACPECNWSGFVVIENDQMVAKGDAKHA